jgi:hypothetical protein
MSLFTDRFQGSAEDNIVTHRDKMALIDFTINVDLVYFANLHSTETIKTDFLDAL